MNKLFRLAAALAAAFCVNSLCASEPTHPKIDVAVKEQFRSKARARILIRVSSGTLRAAVEKETDAIFANPLTDERTKKLLNDAAYERYREKLQELKESVLPKTGKVGLNYLGEVRFGGEIIALVDDWSALLELASNPRVEYVFLDGEVTTTK